MTALPYALYIIVIAFHVSRLVAIVRRRTNRLRLLSEPRRNSRLVIHD